MCNLATSILDGEQHVSRDHLYTCLAAITDERVRESVDLSLNHLNPDPHNPHSLSFIPPSAQIDIPIHFT